MGIVKARGPGVPKIQDSRSHLAETRGDPCTGSSAWSGPDRVKAHFCRLLRSVVTFSEGGPCLNVDCMSMDERRQGALIRTGN